jgi:hypothetical protein
LSIPLDIDASAGPIEIRTLYNGEGELAVERLSF